MAFRDLANALHYDCSSDTSSCSGAYDEIARMFADGNASIQLEPINVHLNTPHVAIDNHHFAPPPAVHHLAEELQRNHFKGTVCVHVNDAGDVDGLKSIHIVKNRRAHAARHANERVLYLTSEIAPIATLQHAIHSTPPTLGIHLGNGAMYPAWL